MLGFKCGMSDEVETARRVAPGALVMSGRMAAADIVKRAAGCTAMISYGLCGGLAPGDDPGHGKGLAIGQCVIADKLVTPNGVYVPDPAWRARLQAKTKAYEHVWWASDDFNTADDYASRVALFDAHGAWAIDDESMDVAEACRQMNIPFAIMRTVSDVPSTIIPAAARAALKTDGSTDYLEVLGSVLGNLGQLPSLEALADYYAVSLGTLYTAGLQVGPTFQAPA